MPTKRRRFGRSHFRARLGPLPSSSAGHKGMVLIRRRLLPRPGASAALPPDAYFPASPDRNGNTIDTAINRMMIHSSSSIRNVAARSAIFP